ncbi:MAG: hypothetical protein WCH85_02700 [Methanomicrobiales archaeon]
MGIPYLNSDESILLSTHNILIDAVVSEMILTNQRLLLVDSDTTLSRHTEIPFAAIETVTTMESGSADPAISLAILKKSGGTIPLQLVFTQQPRSQRTDERDTWAQGIKEQIALMPAGTAPVFVDFEEDEAEDLKKLIGYKAEGTPAVTEDKNPPAGTRSKNKSPLSSRFHPTSTAGISKNMLIAGAAIVVIILLIAGAAFIYPAFMSPKASVPLPVITPEPTTVAPIVPVTTEVPTAEPTPVAITPEQTASSQPTAITTTSQPQTDVTSTGVWAKIVYDGEYTGSVGTGGRMVQVSGTGGRLYRIPAASTDIVEVAVQKLDTSGLPMTIEVYNNGRVIQQKTIRTPKGTLSMSVDLKTG